MDLNIKRVNGKKKILASSIALVCAATSSFAVAQEGIEEVIVTGIRASLQSSMDSKRDSVGVVDSITAEDIGKFPDTNLAESLQRITGISIDRSNNGEGSTVTARGFGADFNIVTLNGRVMPADKGRSFDFGNLSSDAVSAVDVYKTSKASISGGGMGATIDLKTARPLDKSPGIDFTIQGKALHDTTNVVGSDYTPEVSGLFSWADDDGRFGVSVSASTSKRDSGAQSAEINHWDVREWEGAQAESFGLRAETYDDTGLDVSERVINEPELGQLYARPRDYRINTWDYERQRDNASVTFQFAPVEGLTFTLDHTAARRVSENRQLQSGIWFLWKPTKVVFDPSDSDVSTALIYEEDARKFVTYPSIDEIDGRPAELNPDGSIKTPRLIGIEEQWETAFNNGDLVYDQFGNKLTAPPKFVDLDRFGRVIGKDGNGDPLDSNNLRALAGTRAVRRDTNGNPILDAQGREIPVFAGKDVVTANYAEQEETTLSSTGLNVEWQATDRLFLSLDLHTATAEKSPGLDGDITRINAAIGATAAGQYSINFGEALPDYNIGVADCENQGRYRIVNKSLYYQGYNCNNQIDINDVGSSYANIRSKYQETTTSQFKLDGKFDLVEDGSSLAESIDINFGLNALEVDYTQRETVTDNKLGDWGINFPGDIPNNLLTAVDVPSRFSDYDTTGDFSVGFAADAVDILNWASTQPQFVVSNGGPIGTVRAPEWNQDRNIVEEVSAAYTQFDISGSLGSMPYNLGIGVRVESTDVTSSSLTRPAVRVDWEANDDFTKISPDAGSARLALTQTHSYDHVLPNLDFDIELYEGVKARLSLSKTIARAPYADLQADRSLGNINIPTVLDPSGVRHPATGGNAKLDPLESTNIDLSVEWYYGDASYVSAGYFKKDVENFVGKTTQTEQLFGLRDPSAGSRAEAAIEALRDSGLDVNVDNLFNMMAVLNPTANGQDGSAVAGINNNGVIDVAAFNALNNNTIEAAYDFEALAADPLYNFSVTLPTNNKEATIDGFELAMQHFFGDTGFGISSNVTVVDGDVSFDNGNLNEQFALVGLSDTLNWSLIYEKYGWSARVSYNWRGKFLDSTNVTGRFDPAYTESYHQYDMNIGYAFNDNFQVFLEGVNITEENTRRHGRSVHQLVDLFDLGARYQLGARYTF